MNLNDLTELRIYLNSEDAEDFTFNKASILQGVIMEKIDSEFAIKMHENGLKPYSQCIRMEEKQKVVWYIRSLNVEAKQYIIQPLLSDTFQSFYLEHDKKQIRIVSKELLELSVHDLFQKFYTETVSNHFIIEFLTPTAFKKNGKYSFYPDIFDIFQSIMRRFDSVSKNETMFNEDTLEQLSNSTEIIAYNLRSVNFSLEGVRIPAFIGTIHIKIHASQTMINFANLLFQFGNYSGVGIKTAIGMGSIHVTERKRR